jgi:hypothetical protein
MSDVPPDREIDAAIARLLGYQQSVHFGAEDMYRKPGEDWHVLPHFTADTPEGWAAMREVWQWMEAQGYRIRVRQLPCCERWGCEVKSDWTWLTGCADSVPAAVCAAALKVAEIRKEQEG